MAGIRVNTLAIRANRLVAVGHAEVSFAGDARSRPACLCALCSAPPLRARPLLGAVSRRFTLLLSSCFILIFVRDLACFRISFPAAAVIHPYRPMPVGLGWSSLAPPPRSTGTSLTSGKASAPLRSSLVSFFPALTRRPPRPQHSRCPTVYRLPQRSRAGHLAPPLALVRRHLAAPPGLLILPLSRCAHVPAHSQSPPSANALTNPGPSEVFGLSCHNSSCHSRQRSCTEQPILREITACRPSFPHT